MHFIILNNFITKYDETGKALFFISYDDDLLFWDLSLPETFKSKYDEKLCNFQMELYSFSERNPDEAAKRTFFIEHAQNILEYIAQTVDLKQARIPSYFLNDQGDLDLDFLDRISMNLNDVKHQVQKGYFVKKSVEFKMAYEAKVLILSNEQYLRKDIELTIAERADFEANITDDNLKMDWFEHRAVCSKFYKIKNSEFEGYFAFDDTYEPVFFYITINLVD